MKPHPIAGCWPTREQEWLLQAALLDHDRARSAWRAWQEAARIDSTDPASFRVLPLLYARLRTLEPDDRHLAQLKGVYRQNVYRNRLLIDRAVPVLAALEQRGIATLVLQGAALSERHYRDSGLRSLLQFDLLVRAHQLPVARAALAELQGWVARTAMSPTEGAAFRDPDGFALHLHTHVLPDVPAAAADAACWQRAVAIDYHGVGSRVLDDTDELLRICIGGARWERLTPLLWIPDALAVLRGGTIDWIALLETARRWHLVVHLREALTYLSTRFQAQVPQQALADLHALAVPRRELREHRAQTRARGLMGALPENWYRYRLRLAATGNPLGLWAGFWDYQTRLLGLSSPWQLPGALLTRAARRLRAGSRDAPDQAVIG